MKRAKIQRKPVYLHTITILCVKQDTDGSHIAYHLIKALESIKDISFYINNLFHIFYTKQN